MDYAASGVDLLAHLACERVVLAFYGHLDANEYDGMLALVHPEGVWHRQGTKLARAEIMPKLLERLPSVRTHHVVTNFRTTLTTSGVVEVRGYVTVYRQDQAPDAGPQVAGPYGIQTWRGELRLIGDSWLLYRIDGTRTYAAPGRA